MFTLDIPDTTKDKYKKRFDRIKKRNLLFEPEEKVVSYKGCDYYSFGRVLHIRKFKNYAVVIFLVNGFKDILILKNDIKNSFLNNVRRNDYIYAIGKKQKERDILLLYFQIVSISSHIESKKKDFLHQRLVDNQKNYSILKQYSEAYANIYKIFKKAGYIEIKSKILQDSFYGGASRPFRTYSNNSHRTKYLKFSSEPVLKEMLVGGIERAYEFGTVFRNEPDSKIRGEEIRALEFCSANEDFEDFRKTLFQLIKKILGFHKISRSDYNNICKRKNSLLSYKYFKSKIVPTMIKPTMIYNLPSGTSPFISTIKEDPSFALREILIINGMTIAEIYQNERDPFKQIEFLEGQFLHKKNYKVDYSSYIHSQLYGSPIINVCFVSIDRLLSLLTNQDDIRNMI